jgi:hypothetical protein
MYVCVCVCVCVCVFIYIGICIRSTRFAGRCPRLILARARMHSRSISLYNLTDDVAVTKVDGRLADHDLPQVLFAHLCCIATQ